MTQLLKSDSISAYNILSNLCSMESNEYMDILVQRYQIHIYLVLNIETKEYNDKTITMLSGIANLLYSSNTLLKKVALYFLEFKIFEQFIKLSQIANDATTEQKVYLLRACLGMLLVVDQFEFQHQVGYNMYADILKLGVDWIQVDIDLGCVLIQKASKYLNNIIRYTSIDMLQYLLIQAIFTYNKKPKQVELLIDTFNKFIQGGDIDLIVELLDRQNVQEDILRLCDQKYHKIHKNIMEFFLILANLDSQIINNYCIEMLPTITGIFVESSNPQVCIKYGKFINNLEIEDNTNYIYELLDKLIQESNIFHSSEKTKMLQILNKLIGDRMLSITKEQHYYLEQLTNTLDDILEKTVAMVLAKIVEM